jgi:hypothetical protein
MYSMWHEIHYNINNPYTAYTDGRRIRLFYIRFEKLLKMSDPRPTNNPIWTEKIDLMNIVLLKRIICIGG